MKTKKEQMLFFDNLETPVGALFLVFSGSILAAISFERPAGLIPRRTEHSTQVRQELEEYFANQRTQFSCRTGFLEGTDFEKEVWALLKEIPYGETRTYKWVAERMGQPKASRAVGNALAKNPIPIVIPCHRVVESSGSIGGYTPGVDIKRRLLAIEYYTATARKGQS